MKNKTTFIVVATVLFFALLSVSGAMYSKWQGTSALPVVGIEQSGTGTSTVPGTDETMSLTLYVQDKEIARVSDCSATRKVTYEVPKTTAVADASLRILFGDELARYGTYESVRIEDGVAKVTISNSKVTSAPFIESLSSCEAAHLMSVLNKTLAQYESVQSVEIFTLAGKVEF
ncbi:MAG TPA: hypothetical protein VGE62_03130 [Candidatus Paceibacterota bacterium]